MRSCALLATVLALTAACVRPVVYERPPVETPPAFRGASPSSSTAAALGDQKWFEVFQDETLQSLIRTALERNDTLQIAATRIVEAQAQLRLAHADELPVVSAGGSVFSQRTSNALGFPSRTVHALQVQGSAAWEIDFWGKFRSAREAARAQLLATEWGRRAVASTLVGQVASAYFGLRTLDRELDIANRTLESRQESLRLTEVRERGGVAPLVDVRQAEQLVYGVSAEIVNLNRDIEQQENLISVLLGGNPGPIARGRTVDDQPRPPDVPAGLPSALIERRPDIMQAEMELAAASAEIGVAKAAYFPSISLTGAGGLQTAALSSLLSGGPLIWSAVAAATAPVFTGGRRQAQVSLAEARQHEAALVYRQVVLQAFREVSDALVGYSRAREFRTQQGLLLTSAGDARRLADLRYQGGAASYLEVLDADTRLLSAELDSAQAQLNELNGLVTMYRTLGGGWQP